MATTVLADNNAIHIEFSADPASSIGNSLKLIEALPHNSIERLEAEAYLYLTLMRHNWEQIQQLRLAKADRERRQQAARRRKDRS